MTPYSDKHEFVRLLREALRNSYKKEGWTPRKAAETANDDIRADRVEHPYRKQPRQRYQRRPDGSYGE